MRHENVQPGCGRLVKSMAMLSFVEPTAADGFVAVSQRGRPRRPGLACGGCASNRLPVVTILGDFMRMSCS